MKVNDKLKLASPDIWQGAGCDTDSIFTVFDVQQSSHFGSGVGVKVRPAVDTVAGNEMSWYDSGHFTCLPDNANGNRPAPEGKTQ